MTYISWSSDFNLLFFALKNILVLLAQPDSSELRCPATALIFNETTFLFEYFLGILRDALSYI